MLAWLPLRMLVQAASADGCFSPTGGPACGLWGDGSRLPDAPGWQPLQKMMGREGGLGCLAGLSCHWDFRPLEPRGCWPAACC